MVHVARHRALPEPLLRGEAQRAEESEAATFLARSDEGGAVDIAALRRAAVPNVRRRT